MKEKLGLEVILLPIIGMCLMANEIERCFKGLVVGTATAVSVVGGGAIYGYNDAKGNHLSGKEYLIPAALMGAIYAGRKFGCDDEKMAAGLIATGTATILGAASYGIGYATGRIS